MHFPNFIFCEISLTPSPEGVHSEGQMVRSQEEVLRVHQRAPARGGGRGGGDHQEERRGPEHVLPRDPDQGAGAQPARPLPRPPSLPRPRGCQAELSHHFDKNVESAYTFTEIGTIIIIRIFAITKQR